jgi:SAM-dependent methyltransferase
MENGAIPFPSESFDCIVNNQVFEHVEDLDFVLSEIRRVLKRDGVLLSMFPSKDVVREGHCGVPLAHRFAKYPRFGYYWLLVGRLLGFGYHKKTMSPEDWARNFQHWLNHYCTYRSKDEIVAAFQRHGLPVQGIEEEYIRFRGLWPFTPWMFRKLGGMVLRSIKVQLAPASAPARMVSFRIAGDDLSQRQSSP